MVVGCSLVDVEFGVVGSSLVVAGFAAVVGFSLVGVVDFVLVEEVELDGH